LRAVFERLALVPPAPGSNVYHAFISYSHAADGQLAPSLQRSLQRFAKPWYRPRALRVFRDEVSLSANPHLWTSIEQALAGSHHFILLASPEAAASPWVAREAERWRETKSTDTLLVGLTDGELAWDEHGRDFDWDRTDALPPTLAGAFAEEPRWIDLRWARNGDDLTLGNPHFRDAVAELAAPLHGRPKDELAGEEVRQHRRTVRIVRTATAAFAVLTALAVAASILSLILRNRAIDERQFSVSRELAAQSLLQLGTDPELSMLLAIESAEARHTTESLAALRRSLAANHLRRTLPGTSAPLNAVAWSQDGRLVAAGDRSGDVRVWDAGDGELLHVLESDNWDIQGVAFDPSGTRVLVNPREGMAAVWNLTADDTPIVLEEPVDFRVFRAAWSPDGRFVVTSGTVTAPARLWDPESGELLRDFGEPPSGDTAFSPDGRLLATAESGGLVRIWRVATGSALHSLQASGAAVGSSAGLPGFVSSVRFSPDGGRLLTGAGDGSARIFDVGTGEQVAYLPAHADLVALAVWSPDGEEVATASHDRTARVWNPATEFVVTLRGHAAALNSVQFSPDGQYVLTGGDDGLARVFEAHTGNESTELRGHQGGSVTAAFSPDGGVVLTAGQDGTARLWAPGVVAPEASPPLPLTTDDSMVGEGQGVPRLDPLARAFLLTRGDDPGTEIRNTMTGEFVARLEGDPSVRSASFDASGRLLFTAHQADFTARAGRLWDARSGRLLRALNGAGSAAQTGVLTDDGSLLATVESSGVVTVWRTATGERVKAFRRHTKSEAPYSLFVSTVFSDDGSLLLTGDTAGKAYLWRIRDGRLLNSFEGPPQEPRSENNVPSGAISRDNSLVLFTNPWDQLGRLYRVGEPTQVGVLRGTSTGIISSRFNSDGTLIVTNGEDGSRVWDVASREPLLVLPGGQGAVAFANDGHSVVLAPDSRLVSEPFYRQTFECEVCGGIAELLALARERVSRQLTAAESSQYLHR
jgi:WD40 repeat protein